MGARLKEILVGGLVAVLFASVVAPGLTLHNCRQYGTRSTQLCACCEAEQASEGSCCSTTSETVAASSHDQTTGAGSIVAECCFTSIEGPFSFDGHSGAIASAPAPNQQTLDADAFSAVNDIAATVSIANPQSAIRNRHSSDPPSYILTHSFRC